MNEELENLMKNVHKTVMDTTSHMQDAIDKSKHFAPLDIESIQETLGKPITEYLEKIKTKIQVLHKRD